MPLGPLTIAALAAGCRLRLGRNRWGTYTADLVPVPGAGGTEIGATMPTPVEALEQLERAIDAAYARPPAGVRRATSPRFFTFS
jgi:hypothetical protein